MTIRGRKHKQTNKLTTEKVNWNSEIRQSQPSMCMWLVEVKKEEEEEKWIFGIELYEICVPSSRPPMKYLPGWLRKTFNIPSVTFNTWLNNKSRHAQTAGIYNIFMNVFKLYTLSFVTILNALLLPRRPSNRTLRRTYPRSLPALFSWYNYPRLSLADSGDLTEIVPSSLRVHAVAF